MEPVCAHLSLPLSLSPPACQCLTLRQTQSRTRVALGPSGRQPGGHSNIVNLTTEPVSSLVLPLKQLTHTPSHYFPNVRDAKEKWFETGSPPALIDPSLRPPRDLGPRSMTHGGGPLCPDMPDRAGPSQAANTQPWSSKPGY